MRWWTDNISKIYHKYPYVIYSRSDWRMHLYSDVRRHAWCTMFNACRFAVALRRRAKENWIGDSDRYSGATGGCSLICRCLWTPKAMPLLPRIETTDSFDRSVRLFSLRTTRRDNVVLLSLRNLMPSDSHLESILDELKPRLARERLLSIRKFFLLH